MEQRFTANLKLLRVNADVENTFPTVSNGFDQFNRKP